MNNAESLHKPFLSRDEFKEYFAVSWNAFACSPLMICAILVSAALIIFNTGPLGAVLLFSLQVVCCYCLLMGAKNERDSNLIGINLIVAGMVLGLGAGGLISVFMLRTVLRIKNNVQSKDPYEEPMLKSAILLFITGACVTGFAFYMYTMTMIDGNALFSYILLFVLHVLCGGLLLRYGKMKSNIFKCYQAAKISG